MFIRLTYTASVAVACSLAVLSAFLPWVSLEVELPIVGSIGTVTRRGYDGDGIITLLLGLLALGFALYLWSDRSAVAFRLVTLFNTFLGALIFAIALANLVDSQRALGDAQRQLGVDFELLVGIDLQSLVDTREGIYITIAAGAILAAASLLAFSADRLGLAGLRATDASGATTAGSRVCPDCRTKLPASAKYCLDCGQPQQKR